MRHVLFPALLCLPLLVQGAVAGNTEVRYVLPENFTDAYLDRSHGRGASEALLKELRQYIEQLGGQYLGSGHQLRIAVHDIDLAGRFEPWRVDAMHLRFMREFTWPRIELAYTLSQDGRVLASRAEVVRDMNYLWGANRARATERLYFEKAMLADWFRDTFGKTQSARH